MKKYIILVLILISNCLMAQESKYSINSFFYKQDADVDFKFTPKESSFSNSGIRYGVVFAPLYVSSKNGENVLDTFLTNSQVWGLSYLWSGSYLYARGKASTVSVVKAEGSYGEVENDYLFDLDMAFLSSSAFNNKLKLDLGRRFFSMGTGLILGGRGDGAKLETYISSFDIKLLGMYTGLLSKDNNPYYLNDSDLSDGAKRAFAGTEITMHLMGHRVYGMALAQFDMAEKNEKNPTRYFSQYYGGGAKGNLFTYLDYFGEFVYESGKSYVALTDKKYTISAYAMTAGFTYFLQTALNPALLFRYSLASGDPDRDNYVSSVRSSSSNKDKGFIYFGSFTGGYALNPRLSNIQIFKGGFSITPLSMLRQEYLNRICLVTNYLYYLKAEKKSPINDGEAALEKAYIGQEIDFSLRWKIFSDLSAYMNMGIFFPGDAFESGTEKKTFIMAGMNIHF